MQENSSASLSWWHLLTKDPGRVENGKIKPETKNLNECINSEMGYFMGGSFYRFHEWKQKKQKHIATVICEYYF